MKSIKTIFLITLFLIYGNVVSQTYTVDPSFNSGNSGVLGGGILKIFPLDDGKMLIAGSFTSYNGISCKHIAKLNADGTLDESFSTGSGASAPTGWIAYVRDLTVDSEGKILAVGKFSSFNGSTKNCVVRLNPDGTLDNTFTGSGIISSTGLTSDDDRRIETVKIDVDGKILIGGQFRISNQTSPVMYGLMRLNSNGSRDTGFNLNVSVLNNYSKVTDIELQSNNKIVVSISNLGEEAILRFNTDGSTDNTFTVSAYGFGNALQILPDDKILLGAGVIGTYLGGGDFRILLKLNADGTIDPNFNSYLVESGSSTVNSVFTIRTQNNKILIGGNMSIYGGISNYGITRLNNDGTVDASFDIGSGTGSTSATVNDIEIDSSGKILLCGSFSSFNGAIAKAIARLEEGELSNGTFQRNTLSFNNIGDNYEFHSSQELISEIIIFDLTGKSLIKYTDINDVYFSVSSNFPKGVKIIRATLANGSEEVFKTVD